MSKRSYLIPFGASVSHSGLVQPVFFLQRKDHWAPSSSDDINDFSDKILAIGGAIERGENELVALERELGEEMGNWYSSARIPMSKIYCGIDSGSHFKIDDLAFYLRAVDGGPLACRKYCECTKEGVPAIMTLSAIENSASNNWAIPDLKRILVSAGAKIKASFKI